MPATSDARTRLLDAALVAIREQGFAATGVADLCARAGVTKGAFFHHFATKEALGVAAAQHWDAVTARIFETAPYHAPEDPLDRLFAYVAFRRALIAGDLAAFTCVFGTLAQEVHASAPTIRDACGAGIADHAATLEPDIAAAVALHGTTEPVDPRDLALHVMAVIQGAFVLAKAMDDPDVARASLDHLDRYLRLLFPRAERAPRPQKED